MSPKAFLRRYVLTAALERRVWRLCVRWPFLADVYYCVTGGFRREHRGVLLGKLRHQEDMRDKSDLGAQYTLRRNTHRLEKGLIMRPRRPVFAKDYIGETVNVYVGLRRRNVAGIEPLMRWATDVLTDYFDAVESDPAIDPLREAFNASQSEEGHTEPCDERLVPYKRDESPLRIDIEGMEQLAWRRRSVRWFEDRPVPREVLDRAISVAKLSPSACNRQPFSFRVFDDKELATRIGAIPGGTKGFAQNFPCVIVIVGDLRAYFHDRDRHVIYVDGGLAAMALQFALEVQGVGSCCINWPDVESREQEMDAALGLEPNQRPIMCMAVGYPDRTGSVPYSQKKQLDEIRSYNQTC
ncbi:MAG: nitroreductase family protein [Planctomycetota bacterium]